MNFQKGKLSEKILLELYEGILRPWMIEQKMLVLVRQGKISKWFSGIGQEAIAVGSTMGLKDDEYILPMHRNLGVFTTRKIPLGKLFAQFQGKESGFTKGRDRSFHFGTTDFKIVGMISHLGAQLGVADGIALGNLLDKSGKVTLVFTGDGGASEGDFHEALNVAAVWKLPVIFLIENNGYGLSTPSKEQFAFKNFTDKGAGYGMEAVQIDGNNVLEVYTTVKSWAEKIRRRPQPVIIEAITFRIRGHEEASGVKYVPKKLLDSWALKDPVDQYEKFLLKEGILDEERQQQIKDRIKHEIETGLEQAYSSNNPVADSVRELKDVYAGNLRDPTPIPKGSKSQKRFVDALSDGLRQSLEKYPDLVFMGQDIAEYGGVFKVSEGFIHRFGEERIRNTPICESAIIGAGLGLSVMGRKSIIEMQFADFVSCGFNQIVNNLAKSHYRWQQNADVVIRMPTGAGVNAGPFHSQSNEAWFFHTPGLKIVYPSNPFDAKGLIIAAVEDPNPVMYFEHKKLYRSISDEIPDDYYSLPIGKASLVREGNDISIITYGAGVHWALEVAVVAPDISVDILDLRSLMPWDQEAVKTSVMKTGKVLILHEDSITGGIGGEISAWISENCFKHLDGPIMRVGSLDTPVPFTATLEDNYLPNGRLLDKMRELAEF